MTPVTDFSFNYSLNPTLATSIWLLEETMARKSLTLVFGIVLAMAVVLTITTWAASPKREGDSTVPARGTIYRPDLWKVY